jgi:hypothetical protein
MLSYLLYVVSLVNGHSGFVDRNLETQLKEVEMSGETSGGLVVKMGPVMNLRLADVRVFPAGSQLPVITQKGSLFEGFSHSRLYAIHYGK